MLKKMLLVCAIVCFLPVTIMAASIIKLGVVTKPGSAQNIAAEKFKEILEKRSGKSFQVRIFHSSSIGNETEILQQVQMNTIQMAIITDGPFDTFDPIVRVINYPFLFKDNSHADAVLDGPLGARILKSLENSGFKGLCFSENGFRNLSNSKRPVRGPADIKGLKIRVMDSAVHQAIWRELGANPTPMPWPIYTELEQGVIDGQENPLWVSAGPDRQSIMHHFFPAPDHVDGPHGCRISTKAGNRIRRPAANCESSCIFPLTGGRSIYK